MNNMYEPKKRKIMFAVAATVSIAIVVISGLFFLTNIFGNQPTANENQTIPDAPFELSNSENINEAFSLSTSYTLHPGEYSPVIHLTGSYSLTSIPQFRNASYDNNFQIIEGWGAYDWGYCWQLVDGSGSYLYKLVNVTGPHAAGYNQITLTIVSSPATNLQLYHNGAMYKAIDGRDIVQFSNSYHDIKEETFQFGNVGASDVTVQLTVEGTQTLQFISTYQITGD